MTLHFRRRVATVSSIIVATQRHNMGPHRVTIFVCSFTVRDTSRRTETRTVVTQSQMLRISRMAHFLAARNVAKKRCSKMAIFSFARRNFSGALQLRRRRLYMAIARFPVSPLPRFLVSPFPRPCSPVSPFSFLGPRFPVSPCRKMTVRKKVRNQ